MLRDSPDVLATLWLKTNRYSLNFKGDIFCYTHPMTTLHHKTCTPCQGGVPPLTQEACQALMGEIDGWELIESSQKIRSTFTFASFAQAQDFATSVGSFAEEEQHHPDISYGWGYCSVIFYTHKIGGLHENDFIMAAKVSAIKSSSDL